jgi:acetyl esterase/lipase
MIEIPFRHGGSGGLRFPSARWLLRLIGLAWLILIPPMLAEGSPGFKRLEDVIYGRKYGTALTLDVFQPQKTNGYGVVAIMSGGFFSSHDWINPALFAVYLKRGYTVFAVVHGSQPKFIIPEAQQDLHRAVRFIRSHAAQYGIQPDRLWVTGASAGGHLSLTLGTQGGPGEAQAKDPVDRESSAVQAVACFFPPTDLLNYGQPGIDAVGVGILKEFKPAFGPRSDTAESRQVYGQEISPIYYVTSNLPPTLIIHGDADKLVPIQQAERFVERARAMGTSAKLVRREGKEHGWPDLAKDMELCADWFDEYLRGLKH